jgi:hypothetical protein
MLNIMELLNHLRKSSVFPSINDIEWRHNEVVARLIQIYETQKKLDIQITSTEIETQKNVIEFLSYIQPLSISVKEKIRIGSIGDGGYVQLNDLANITLALSFGINDNDSWDFDIATRGIAVKQYDYTVEHAPSKHPLLEFHKIKVAGVPGEGKVTLQDLIISHEKTEQPNIILKIDIEGSEWEVFDNIKEEQLTRVSQILCEFHGLSKLNHASFYTLALRVMQKIHKYFIPYHVHGNNNSCIVNIGNVAFPDVIEVSFANRKIFTACKSDEIFPTRFDYPNNPEFPDIFLGPFQFTRKS